MRAQAASVRPRHGERPPPKQEGDRILAALPGMYREHSLSTQAIDDNEHLIPGEVLALQHKVIQRRPRRSHDDFQDSMICFLLVRHTVSSWCDPAFH